MGAPAAGRASPTRHQKATGARLGAVSSPCKFHVGPAVDLEMQKKTKTYKQKINNRAIKKKASELGRIYPPRCLPCSRACVRGAPPPPHPVQAAPCAWGYK